MPTKTRRLKGCPEKVRSFAPAATFHKIAVLSPGRKNLGTCNNLTSVRARKQPNADYCCDQ